MTITYLESAQEPPYFQLMQQFAISESAAAQISKIIAGQNDGQFLRVAVQGGGCSGFSYVFSIEGEKAADDLAFERDGVTVLVDEMSIQYMEGSEIDWVDDMIGASFQIKNPNATASCGCGTSFDV
jgi:iron-sulfur cluster assembly accessory protein